MSKRTSPTSSFTKHIKKYRTETNQPVFNESQEFDEFFDDIPDEAFHEESFEEAGQDETFEAIKVLRRDFPLKETFPQVPCIIPVYLLYNILHDRTTTDREIERLREEKKILKFKLGTRDDDFSILLKEDYIEQIENLKTKQPESSKLFDDFLEFVLESQIDVSITKKDLFEKVNCIENQITILVQTGLLLLKDVESYWLSIPHFGIFIQYVVKGRDEILKTLKKRRNGEVMEEFLVQKKMKNDQINLKYLIDDLILRGEIQSIETTGGRLLRLRKN